MRFRFKPTFDQRAALRAQLARLLQPAAALEALRPVLPPDFKPVNVICACEGIHKDRFVLRAQVRSDTGAERAYALKAYSDDFGGCVWEHAQRLAACLSGSRPRNRASPVYGYEDEDEGKMAERVAQPRPEGNQPNRNGLCLPIAFLPQERLLIFPWVYGPFLSEIVDGRKPELLRQAARLAAGLHRLDLVPEKLTTAQMLVDETRAWCGRLRIRWPQAAPIVAPLMHALQEALPLLEPAEPAPVHGDMAAGQFLWTGERLVLLDLDMFGYTDPAYDAGHFLAQLERRCLVDPAVRANAREWLAAFSDAYLAAMPQVSPRNVWFYRGLTLLRKCYTICRREPVQWPRLVPQFAEHARAALEQVVAPELAHSKTLARETEPA